uniref:Telomere length regulation protein conserved domain-containing protein n=1 Tax=Chromera velia CCMP2878 TaxID=1169474 RepID=A0A0G4GNB2_9ALVE|eukprot:Cvel_4959.t1-p1 / transcript=Cvel_4959.t1 / gene=Cvel_4959 / organism=Chromera_velia_CCMP2878 / gene_product=hypothetical protein / transcript_product=hypothetical protein / location=Cvel_scaffold224:36964-42559(+) / protein_length=930 / sequence_SO=supercontig / SO=protein_coding / is_pseudo=false
MAKWDSGGTGREQEERETETGNSGSAGWREARECFSRVLCEQVFAFQGLLFPCGFYAAVLDALALRLCGDRHAQIDETTKSSCWHLFENVFSTSLKIWGSAKGVETRSEDEQRSLAFAVAAGLHICLSEARGGGGNRGILEGRLQTSRHIFAGVHTRLSSTLPPARLAGMLVAEEYARGLSSSGSEEDGEGGSGAGLQFEELDAFASHPFCRPFFAFSCFSSHRGRARSRTERSFWTERPLPFLSQMEKERGTGDSTGGGHNPNLLLPVDVEEGHDSFGKTAAPPPFILRLRDLIAALPPQLLALAAQSVELLSAHEAEPPGTDNRGLLTTRVLKRVHELYSSAPPSSVKEVESKEKPPSSVSGPTATETGKDDAPVRLSAESEGHRKEGQEDPDDLYFASLPSLPSLLHFSSSGQKKETGEICQQEETDTHADLMPLRPPSTVLECLERLRGPVAPPLMVDEEAVVGSERREPVFAAARRVAQSLHALPAILAKREVELGQVAGTLVNTLLDLPDACALEDFDRLVLSGLVALLSFEPYEAGAACFERLRRKDLSVGQRLSILEAVGGAAERMGGTFEESGRKQERRVRGERGGEKTTRSWALDKRLRAEGGVKEVLEEVEEEGEEDEEVTGVRDLPRNDTQSEEGRKNPMIVEIGDQSEDQKGGGTESIVEEDGGEASRKQNSEASRPTAVPDGEGDIEEETKEGEKGKSVQTRRFASAASVVKSRPNFFSYHALFFFFGLLDPHRPFLSEQSSLHSSHTKGGLKSVGRSLLKTGGEGEEETGEEEADFDSCWHGRLLHSLAQILEAAGPLCRGAESMCEAAVEVVACVLKSPILGGGEVRQRTPEDFSFGPHGPSSTYSVRYSGLDPFVRRSAVLLLGSAAAKRPQTVAVQADRHCWWLLPWLRRLRDAEGDPLTREMAEEICRALS